MKFVWSHKFDQLNGWNNKSKQNNVAQILAMFQNISKEDLDRLKLVYMKECEGDEVSDQYYQKTKTSLTWSWGNIPAGLQTLRRPVSVCFTILDVTLGSSAAAWCMSDLVCVHVWTLKITAETVRHSLISLITSFRDRIVKSSII